MALVIEATDTHKDGSNTTSTNIDVTLPSYSSGALVIIAYSLWNNRGTPTVTWANGPNGEAVTSVVNGYGASGSNGLQICIGWFIATANYGGGDMANDSSVSTRWGAAIIIVPAGEFDSTTPISSAVSYANTAANEANLDMPAFSAGATDGGGKLLVFCGSDQDPWSTTMPAGYTQLEVNDYGRAAITLAGRDAAVTDSESISAANFDLSGTAQDAIAIYAFIVRESSATNMESSATNMQINIGDVWKDVSEMQINIGDTWKTVVSVSINIGDTWKTVF